MAVRLLFVLMCHSISYDDRCVAPLVAPPSIAGKKLKFVQVLTRHGARAPLAALLPAAQRGYWLCDSADAVAPRMHAAPVAHFRRFKQVLDQRLTEYLPNCRSGDLLVSGMQQHELLGQFYHKYLYESNKILTELPPNPENIYARCSDVERTFRSAQSFLHGLFPPQSPNEIIDIYADTADGSLLRPNKEWCSNMSQIWANFSQSSNYTSWISTNWQALGELPQYLGFSSATGENLNAVCDFVSTHYCDNKRLPSIVTSDMEQVCLNVTGSYLYDFFTIDPYVAGSVAMRELVRVASSFANKTSKIVFSLMSSHDTTVAAVLALLGERRERIPPFASHLSMELWDNDDSNYTVRFALNGEEIKLREFGGNTSALYSDFLSKYSRIYEVCNELP